MKTRKIYPLSFLVLSVFVFQARTFADVAYDSLSTSVISSIGIRDIGNTITLNGNKRFVTSFSFRAGIGSSSAGQTNDYILRFYLPTGPNNYPGKLFWQSPPNANVVLTGGTQTITFDVPHVRVPDTFIFSIMQAGDSYFTLCGGPVTGNSPEYCWTNLTYSTFPGSNHLQVKIETQDRADASLLGTIHHSSTSGIGGEDYYSMGFEMRLGGYWNLFGPSFYGVTEWDKGSYLQIDGADLPDAVAYLSNGVDESLRVLAESTSKGNVESDTIVKSPGIASGHPDLYGCVISDFGLQLDNIVIDHSTPGWTYYTHDVTWEIWGIEKTADFNKDGKINMADFSILSSAWETQAGQTNWNMLCDLELPWNNQIDVNDLQLFCASWFDDGSSVLEENFETGDFSLYNWQHSGNTSWSVASDEVSDGTYAAKSGNITHNEQSTLQIEIDVDGEAISFFKKVSSESNWDYFRFYIDGVEQDAWSGEIGWSQETFPVTPGTHIFKWSYTKDSSFSSGSDCAWIDQILID